MTPQALQLAAAIVSCIAGIVSLWCAYDTRRSRRNIDEAMTRMRDQEW